MKTTYSLNESDRRGRRRGPVEIAMTPMIDVVFLLLVFFLATASFELVEQMLPGNLSSPPPGASAADTTPPPIPTEDFDDVVVRLAMVADSLQVDINGAVLGSVQELPARLLAIIQIRSDVPVIVDPSGQVPMRNVIQVYDMARMSGATRVFMAAK